MFIVLQCIQVPATNLPSVVPATKPPEESSRNHVKPEHTPYGGASVPLLMQWVRSSSLPSVEAYYFILLLLFEIRWLL